MNVDNAKSYLVFKGRASVIKDADKICRNVNSAFTHISPSYSWVNLGKPIDYDPLFTKIDDKLRIIRKQKNSAVDSLDYYKKLMSLVKKYKCANCGEMADITYLYCKSRKLKDVNIVGIYGYNPKSDSYIDYDHVAVRFRAGKKDIIIDPWFGITDFARNCIVKYKQKYHDFFENFNPNLKLSLLKESSVYIDKDDLEKLIKLFPEIK